jgi:hypothetical protein
VRVAGILQKVRGAEAFDGLALAVSKACQRAMNSSSLPAFTRQFPDA